SACERGECTRGGDCRHASAIKILERTHGEHRPHASEGSAHAEEIAGTRAPPKYSSAHTKSTVRTRAYRKHKRRRVSEHESDDKTRAHTRRAWSSRNPEDRTDKAYALRRDT